MKRVLACFFASAAAFAAAGPVFTDFRTQTPGLRHRLRPKDLPPPFQTESAVNGPSLIKRPEGAWPRAADGFVVSQYASGLDEPRLLRRAPNGDLFAAESRAGRIRVLRGVGKDGRALKSAVFA